MAVTADFSQTGTVQTGAPNGSTLTDFSGLYTDPSAPKPNPSDDLYRQLSTASKSLSLSVDQQSGHLGDGQAGQGAVQRASPKPASTAPGAPAPASTPAAGSSLQASSGDEAALLARLAPLGITSVSQLKGKNDTELRKISSDAVEYENRQADLAKHFSRNADGSWDFTKGPDGAPTGLDATGKALPPLGSEPPAQQGQPQGQPAPKPAPKPAPQPAAKPKPKPKPAPKRVVRAKPAAKKVVKAAPKPKKPAVKVVRKPAAPSGAYRRAVI